MVAGLLLTSVATAMMSTALFTRRSRAGWLDELDGIRGGALADPSGGVDRAMAGFEPISDDGSFDGAEGSDSDRSPLTALEVPMAPAAAGPRAPTAVTAEPSFDEAPSGEAPPEDSSSGEVAPEDASSAGMVAEDRPPPPVLSELPPPPSVVEESPRPAEPVATDPSPHPIRPHEMWHPDVIISTIAPHEPESPAVSTDEPSAGEAEPEEEAPARFRFARLRAVLPSSGDDDGAASSLETGDAELHSSLVSELCAPYGGKQEQGNDADGEATESDSEDPGSDTSRTSVAEQFLDDVRPVATPLEAADDHLPPWYSEDRIESPLVPSATPGDGPVLISGPISRRSHGEQETGRRRELSTVFGQVGRADQDPPAHTADARSTESEPSEAEILEPEVPEPEAAEPEVLEPEVLEPEAAEPEHFEPAPSEPERSEPAHREPEHLVLGADSTVQLAGGHLRFLPGIDASVTLLGATASVTLVTGWCWTNLVGDTDGEVVLTVPAGELTIPGGTSTLTVLEASGGAFVVVVDGEASLSHSSGRLRLREGAMALLPESGEPQVDVATPAEISADPIVAANRELDRQR